MKIVVVDNKQLADARAKVDKVLVPAKVGLGMDAPWSATIFYNLEMVERLDIPTMATDGKNIYYNPFFVANLNTMDVITGLIHETYHVGLKHPLRLKGRNQKVFNVACDHVINLLMEEDGHKFPQWACLNHKFRGMTAEQVYDILIKELEEQKKAGDSGEEEEQDGEGEGAVGSGEGEEQDKNGSGKSKAMRPDSIQKQQNHVCAGNCSVIAYPDDPEIGEQQMEELASRAEMVAKSRGLLPSGIAGAIAKMRKHQVDYKKMLDQFLRSTSAHKDYKWERPSRAMLAALGLPLPSFTPTRGGRGVLIRDTSGSCASDSIQEQFLGEMNGALGRLSLDELVVIDCDAAVHEDGIHTYTQYDLPITKCELRGYGGTDFRPPFKWIRDNLGWRPDFCVYLTDGYGSFPEPEDAPDYPVLWVFTSTDVTAPFGITARILVRG